MGWNLLRSKKLDRQKYHEEYRRRKGMKPLAEYLAVKAANKLSDGIRRLRTAQRNRLTAYNRGGLTWEEYSRRRSEAKQQRLMRIATERAARRAERQARPPRRTKAEIAAMQKAWRMANADRYRALQKAWRASHPERNKARKKTRSKRLREYLRTLQRNKCAICGQRLQTAVHIDHIIPKKLGGVDARSNLQLTHPNCNLAKHAHHPIDYAQQKLGRLL